MGVTRERGGGGVARAGGKEKGESHEEKMGVEKRRGERRREER